jgi:transcriptional regulator with XRE-family HTH domain
MVACSQTGSGREEKTKTCSSPEKATTLEQEETTMCGIGSCQVPMANGSAKEPEASGQFPLAKLVARRRREIGLTLAEVARLMDKAAAAEEVGGYCLANRQSIHEYEHGRIPYNGRLRLLAAALGVPFAEARAAAEAQSAHRQIARAAGSILRDAADTGGPPDPATTGVSSPGANLRPQGAPAPARVVIATLPDSEHAWLALGDGATSTARPTWGAGHEGLILEAPARQPGDNEYVNRRQLLIDLGVLGLAAPLAGAEAVRQGLTAAVAGDSHAADVDEWERIVHEYARSYNVTPIGQLLRDLTADLSVLQRRLGGTDGTVQRSLARSAGQLAAMCALAWRDAGEPRQAGRWWRTARQLADRSGDSEVCTWVRGQEVMSGLCEQRPVPVILDRAAEAASIARPLTGAGSAQLYSGLAQTLAVAGRGDEAVAALERLADLTDQLPARVVADEGSVLGWPEVRLRHTESYVHTWLGDTRRAYAAQEAALQIYPESLARERGKLLLHRGACMIQDGDVGGGLAYAGRVLDNLPVQHHTESVYAIGRAAMRVVPAQERGRPEAAELRARLGISALDEE